MKKIAVKLSTKIAIFTSLIILLTSFFIAASVFYLGKSYLFKLSLNSLQNQAELLANNIQSELNNPVSDLLLLANTPPIQGIIRATENNGIDPVDNSSLTTWNDRLTRIFKSMLVVNPYYTQIRYIGVANNGKELVRVNRAQSEIYVTHPDSLQEKRNEDYFQHSLRLSPGSIIFSKVTWNKEHGKIQYPLVPTIRVIKPIFDDKQKIFGLLVINIDYDQYLKNIIIRTGNKNNLVLYNQYGDYFSYNNHDNTLRFYYTSKKSTAKEHFSSQESLLDLKIMEGKGDVVVSKLIYAGYLKKQPVLKLFIVTHEKDLFQEAYSLVNQIIVIIFIVAIIASLFSFFFAQWLMRHLRKMTVAISESRVGEESTALPISLHDEVGSLARAFRKREKMLAQLALYDSLTGLPNRKSFLDRLEDAILRAKRSQTQIAVFFLDLNNFKEINDTYGHDVGDSLLIEFASKIKQLTRSIDFVARISGDEFALIIENINDSTVLNALLSRYKGILVNQFRIKGFTLHVSSSVGVSLYPDHGEKGEELLKAADEAMYDAKEKGSGEIVLFNKHG